MFAERNLKMSNKFLLFVAAVFIFIGVVKPNFNLPINNPQPIDNIVVVVPPENDELKQQCQAVIDALKEGDGNRNQDGKRLSELYSDLATLIRLDKDKEVVKTTEEIRQANSLAGSMLQMNLQGKYPNLADAAQAVIVKQIGDDIVPLDEDLRGKAVQAFMGLSWACNEGSK
jgi:hypothetical protein